MSRMVQIAMTPLEGDHMLARLEGRDPPCPELAGELDERVQERVRCAVTGKRYAGDRMAPHSQAKAKRESYIFVQPTVAREA